MAPFTTCSGALSTKEEFLSFASMPRIIPSRVVASLWSLVLSDLISTPLLRSRKKLPNGVTQAGKPEGVESAFLRAEAPAMVRIEACLFLIEASSFGFVT